MQQIANYAKGLILFVGSSVASNICANTIELNSISLSSDRQEPILGDGPEEEWNITFGGDDYDVFFVVQETSDSGFIARGGIDANAWDIGGDCLLVKTDEACYSNILK